MGEPDEQREPDVAFAPDAVAVAQLEPTLLEPVRQRLVTVASEVLGRLGPDEIPAALRPVARFTPAKRVRLGASVLAAALDGDASFRQRVAEVVAVASPQLADAVRTGASTAASDPIDAAVVAYLLRPDGWQQIVAQANVRLSLDRQRSGRAQQAEELQRLRSELNDLRARVRGEQARTKVSTAAAVAELTAELADTRRQLRARTAELQILQRRADQAEADALEGRRQLEQAGASRDLEARRSRARVADLERELENARRAGRTERDVDQARLWLLVDTLTQAAAGIRRELSLPAPTGRPADAVAGTLPDAASGAASTAAIRHADDPIALDRLLALPHAHLIVDGYNVTKSGYGELPLADQRRRLVGSLAVLAGRSGAEVTIAFDGGERPPAASPAPRGVRVLFSAADETADDLIRRLVAAEPAGRPVIVVSSDQQVAMDVRRAGAWSVASAVLLAAL